MSDPIRPLVVQTTTATEADAHTIGQALLQQNLAACVQYEAIHSQYTWQGQIHSDAEIRLSIKTAEHLWAAVAEQIVALHPYTCPQILALPVAAIHPPYAQWLAGELAAVKA